MSSALFNIGFSLLSRKEDQSAEARRILSLLEGRPVTESDILREEGGRPYFKHVTSNRYQAAGREEPAQPADFSISHSGNIVAVSHVRGEGLKTGCDVELVKERTNTLSIAENFFTVKENEYILLQKEKGNKAAFFEIWTLKECFLKLRGLSVFDMARPLSVPDFIEKDGGLKPVIDNISFYLYNLYDDERHYILAAAVLGAQIKPELKKYQ